MNDPADRATPPPPRRLGVLGADRPCARCGFNLHSQPIVREPHYSMIIVRCPECAEVAALQEYPALGRWAARIAGAGALVWLVLVLAAAIGTGLVVFHLSRATAVDVLHPAGMRIARSYREFAIVKSEEITDPVQRQQSIAWLESYKVEDWPVVDPAFVESAECAAVMLAVASEQHLDLSRARSIGWLVLWGTLMGAGWAVMTPHLRRRVLPLLALSLTLLAAARWGISIASGSAAQVWGSYYWATDLAFDRFGAPLMPLGLLTGMLALLCGMYVGRPIARGLIVLLLPPRLRAPFGPLWTLQGLSAPPPSRAGLRAP